MSEKTKNKSQKHRAPEQRYRVPEQRNVAECGVSIFVPMDICHPGYATPFINTRLTPRQAAAMKVLWSSLSELNERYENSYATANPKGSAVETSPGGVRWLLDRYADAIEKKTGKSLLVDFELQFRSK